MLKHYMINKHQSDDIINTIVHEFYIFSMVWKKYYKLLLNIFL